MSESLEKSFEELKRQAGGGAGAGAGRGGGGGVGRGGGGEGGGGGGGGGGGEGNRLIPSRKGNAASTRPLDSNCSSNASRGF